MIETIQTTSQLRSQHSFLLALEAILPQTIVPGKLKSHLKLGPNGHYHIIQDGMEIYIFKVNYY